VCKRIPFLTLRPVRSLVIVIGMDISHTLALVIGPPGRWRSSLCVLLQSAPEISDVHQADGLTAVAQWFAKPQPAIVLLDCGLPGEEAWTILQQIKRAWPQARCLILTHDSTQTQRAAKSGADAVLQVGFSGETLYAIIRGILNHP
jgi:DNA-binding NarL/FixJ family response regulator